MAGFPLVSIITPTYNAAKSIGNCIESIRTQKYPNIEFIVVDGLSCDGTLDILKKNSDVVSLLISEKDQGIYDAINKGIKASKGTWIYVLGADDILHDSEVLKEIFEKNATDNLDIIYGNVLFKSSGKIYDGKFNLEKLIDRNICHQAIFTRKSIFEKFGSFDLNFKACADYVFNLKWFGDNNTRILFVDRTIATYSGTGFSAQQGDKKFEREQIDLFVRYLKIPFLSIKFKEKHKLLYHYNMDQKRFFSAFRHVISVILIERKFYLYIRKLFKHLIKVLG